MEKRLIVALSGGLLLWISAVALLCLVPPVSRDALVHHLAIPRLYLEAGGMAEYPAYGFSYYPMNLDILYLIPLYLGNDIAPKFIHFAFGLLTAWLIHRHLRPRLGRAYALTGAILFLSIPIIVKLSITVYVDLGLVFFSAAALFLLLEWIRSGFRMRYLLASALACGLGMGTKYNGLIVCFLLTLFIPWIDSRYRPGEKPRLRRATGLALLYLAVALLAFSPWMVRNWRWTGNPIYPLYKRIFNPEPPPARPVADPGPARKKGRGQLTFRAQVYGESSLEIALLPLRIFFQGEDGNPRYFDGRLNPFLFFLPIAAFIRPRDPPEMRREKGICLAFALLFLAFALFSTVMRIRYIAPMIPPLVVLSVFGMQNLWQKATRLGKPYPARIGQAGGILLLLFFLSLNVGYLASQYRYVRPLAYLSGAWTRAEYISRYRPEYPAMAYINQNLPQDVRILFVFLGGRGYYCHRPYIFDFADKQSKLAMLARTASDPGQIQAGLKKIGITHLLVGDRLLRSWVAEKFSPQSAARLDRFFQQHTRWLFHENGVSLLALKPGPTEEERDVQGKKRLRGGAGP